MLAAATRASEAISQASPSRHPAVLLWAINGGRLVELRRDWAVVQRASDQSRQVHQRERPKAANITLPWIGLR
jgi:hypothetical protein